MLRIIIIAALTFCYCQGSPWVRSYPEDNGEYAQTWWEPQTGYQYNEDNMAEENDDSIAHAAEPVLVRPTDTQPYKAIVYMVLHNNILEEQTCTGVFIAPKTILTAAHCVIVKGKDFTPSIIQRQKGCSNEGVAQYTQRLTLYHPKYKNWEDDYAIIFTNEPSPAWIELPGLASCDSYVKKPLAVFGYPGDDEDKCMYASACSVLKLVKEDKALEYSCDTKKGMSGGPIFADGIMIGVHAAGDNGEGKKEDDFGICLTKAVKDLLDIAIKKYGGK